MKNLRRPILYTELEVGKVYFDTPGKRGVKFKLVKKSDNNDLYFEPLEPEKNPYEVEPDGLVLFYNEDILEVMKETGDVTSSNWYLPNEDEL